jgi:hypothetical protein
MCGRQGIRRTSCTLRKHADGNPMMKRCLGPAKRGSIGATAIDGEGTDSADDPPKDRNGK